MLPYVLFERAVGNGLYMLEAVCDVCFPEFRLSTNFD